MAYGRKKNMAFVVSQFIFLSHVKATRAHMPEKAWNNAACERSVCINIVFDKRRGGIGIYGRNRSSYVGARRLDNISKLNWLLLFF